MQVRVRAITQTSYSGSGFGSSQGRLLAQQSGAILGAPGGDPEGPAGWSICSSRSCWKKVPLAEIH